MRQSADDDGCADVHYYYAGDAEEIHGFANYYDANYASPYDVFSAARLYAQLAICRHFELFEEIAANHAAAAAHYSSLCICFTHAYIYCR